jgi:hypothetical protein
MKLDIGRHRSTLATVAERTRSECIRAHSRSRCGFAWASALAIIPRDVQADDSVSALIAVELSPDERRVLRYGLLMWSAGPAWMTDEIARALWFRGRDDFKG